MERTWFKLGMLSFIFSIFGLFGNFFMIFIEMSGIHFSDVGIVFTIVMSFFILGILALVLGAVARIKKEKNIFVLLAIIFGINSIWLNIIFLMVVAMASSP